MPLNLFSQNVENAISIVEQSTMVFSHFISKWEVSSNARAFYVPAYAWNMFFRKKGGANKHIYRRIRWQKDEIITNKIYYYESKQEYRIADFGGKPFAFLQDKYIGCLLIIGKNEEGPYDAYVLEEQKDIDDFLDYFRLDNTQSTHCIKGIYNSQYNKEKLKCIEKLVNGYNDFPSTGELCEAAQDLIIELKKYGNADIVENCDALIKDWHDVDYRIFEGIEERLYQPYLKEPIGELNKLLRLSKIITNRRKSRAGLSLEHHLSRIFDAGAFEYEIHAKTELNKKPDFLFPNSASYHNLSYDTDKLIMLGAKTTCKDRWRQVLTEADRIRNKYLFTLQPGISTIQLEEMASYNLTLVVPRTNLHLFNYSETNNVIDLKTFISYVKEKQQ